MLQNLLFLCSFAHHEKKFSMSFKKNQNKCINNHVVTGWLIFHSFLCSGVVGSNVVKKYLCYYLKSLFCLKYQSLMTCSATQETNVVFRVDVHFIFSYGDMNALFAKRKWISFYLTWNSMPNCSSVRKVNQLMFIFIFANESYYYVTSWAGILKCFNSLFQLLSTN